MKFIIKINILQIVCVCCCSMFAPISRQEAQLIQQQAPPSYGQLIAQGVIPPVEDFPTENPNEVRNAWSKMKLSWKGFIK